MDSILPPRSWDGVDDVVIVGSGPAGLACALMLAPRPVTLIASGMLGETAGGNATAYTPMEAASDPSNAALLDARMAAGVAAEAEPRLAQLGGKGAALEDLAAMLSPPKLSARVKATPSVRVLEGYVGEQLRTEGDFVTGLVVRDRRGGLSDRLLIAARAVILATGGIAGLYDVRSSRRRGEGLGMAARAGALVADAELVEFTPDGSVAFHIGGVHVDRRGRTTLDGLWACGEAAATGMHGARSRPADRLVEALVFAARVAEDVLGVARAGRAPRKPALSASGPLPPAEEEGEALAALRETMRRNVGPLRGEAGLRQALADIEALAERARTPSLRNGIAAARLIAAGALMRRESRGAHRRSDFPGADPSFARRSFMTLAQAEAAGSPRNQAPR